MVNGFNDHNNSSFGNMIFQQLNEENLVITQQDFFLLDCILFHYVTNFLILEMDSIKEIPYLLDILEIHKVLMFLNR